MSKYRWVVDYCGWPMRLTNEEYVALKQAALNDPTEADRLARFYADRPPVDYPQDGTPAQ